MVRSLKMSPKSNLILRVEKIDFLSRRATIYVPEPDKAWDIFDSQDEPDARMSGLQRYHSAGEEIRIRTATDKWAPHHVLLISLEDIKDEQEVLSFKYVNKPKSYQIVR